jgi:hypothetical protein
MRFFTLRAAREFALHTGTFAALVKQRDPIPIAFQVESVEAYWFVSFFRAASA